MTYTDGSIGLVIDHQLRSMTYAFRPVTGDDDKIILEVPDLINRGYYRSGVTGLAGLVSIGGNFLTLDPIEFADEIVFEYLQKIVKTGNLNERSSYVLALEKLLCILDEFGERMRTGKDKPSRANIPISCSKVQRWLQMDLARNYFTHELLDQKQAQGNFSSLGDGLISIMGPNREESEAIERKARLAVESGQEFDRPQEHGPTVPWKALTESLEVVRRCSGDIVSARILPGPDGKYFGGQMSREWHNGYSDETLALLAQRFYGYFLEEYQNIVNENFPADKARFQFYSILPLHIIGEIYWETNDRHLTCVMLPYQPENKVEIYYRHPGEAPTLKTAGDVVRIRNTEGESLEMPYNSNAWIGGGIGLNDLIYSSHSTPIDGEPNSNQNQASARAVIRNAVYDQIRRDLEMLGFEASELNILRNPPRS